MSTQRREGHCIHHEQPLAIRRVPPSTYCGHISDVATGQVEEGRREGEGGGKWRSMCWFRVRGLHVSFNSKIRTKPPREVMQGAGC